LKCEIEKRKRKPAIFSARLRLGPAPEEKPPYLRLFFPLEGRHINTLVKDIVPQEKIILTHSLARNTSVKAPVKRNHYLAVVIQAIPIEHAAFHVFFFFPIICALF